MKNTKLQHGFTLIEMMVAMSIMLFIFILGYRFVATGFRTTTFGSEQQTAIENARRAMEVMTKEIRGANNSEQGDYPLKKIESDDFEFYSDIDYNGETEKVEYVLDGLELKKVITEPGVSKDYSEPAATTTIANYVNNQDESVFIYYNSSYAETSDIDDIRLIKIRLKINVTPERAPNDYYVETDVHLRNLKDNL